GNRDGLGLQRLNAPEDNQSWYHSVLSDGAYRVQPASDDFATLGAASIQIFRSDLDTTEIELNADLLDFNGNADISGTLVVGGAITGNGSGLTSLNASNLSSGTVPGARLGGNQAMAGNKTFSGNVTIGGVVRAGTIANSTSTTLTPGQIHHVTGNCTVPTLTAGQWVAIVNHSSSPITLTRRSGTALYWALTGENSATVTIGPRGRVVVSCAASGSDYVSGDIVGST